MGGDGADDREDPARHALDEDAGEVSRDAVSDEALPGGRGGLEIGSHILVHSSGNPSPTRNVQRRLNGPNCAMPLAMFKSEKST